MKIEVDLIDKEKLYNAGRDAGLSGSDLDGFVMNSAKLVVVFEYDVDKAEMVKKSIK